MAPQTLFLLLQWVLVLLLQWPSLNPNSKKVCYGQRDEGIKLVSEATCSGIFNDLGSGSNVDVCVITKVCCYIVKPLIISLSSLVFVKLL